MTVNQNNDIYVKFNFIHLRIKSKAVYTYIYAYRFEKYDFYLKLNFNILFSNAQKQRKVINKFNF